MVKNRWVFPTVSGGAALAGGVIVLALLMGGQLFGIAGMLIAVPVTAVLKVFISMYFSCDRSSVFFTGK
jgi:predicted PurR-regulated permease PerM